MKPERYAQGDYLDKLTNEDIGRKVMIKWPKTSDDTAVSGEREVEIVGVLSRDTAAISYKGVRFDLSRFFLRGVDKK